VNCQAATRELSNYIDNELDASLRAELEEHLHGCTHCTVVLSQIKHTVEVFCDAEPVALPPDTRQRLYEALQKKLNSTL
jgi:anti-sigma factor RsiW